MKSRDPSSDRNGGGNGRRSLRAHLRRVAKESLEVIEDELRERVRGFIANSRSVEISKQRLSAVLWSDRALAAHTSPRANPPPAPLPHVPEVVQRVEPAPVAESAQAPAGVFGVSRFELEVEEAHFDEIAEVVPEVEEVIAPELEELPPEAAEALAAEIAELDEAYVEEVVEIAAEVVAPELPAPAVASPAPPPEDDEEEQWVEPIRTRSMARLLAGQGHRDRALAIYDALLALDASDASLRDEADALRQASA